MAITIRKKKPMIRRSFRYPEETDKKLLRIANREKCTPSEIIRYLIDNGLYENNETNNPSKNNKNYSNG